jgi:diacylglycerol kinase family enzyme
VYYYIYDDFIQDKRFEKEVQAVENRLTDLGIAGKIARLALFRDAEEMVRDEVGRGGVSTVVVVGNDETVRKVLDVITQSHVVFGLIPLGPKNTLAELLGVPSGVAACDVLSARIIETIDVGTINGRRFMTGVQIPEFSAEISCEERFRVYPQAQGSLEVWNLSSGMTNETATISNPCDGKLEAIIRTKLKSSFWSRKKARAESILPLSSFAIRSKDPITAYADGVEMTGTRFDISVEPMTLRVITGRGRQFNP